MNKSKCEIIDEIIEMLRARLQEAKDGPQKGDRSVLITGYSEQYVSGRIYEIKHQITELKLMKRKKTPKKIINKIMKIEHLAAQLLDCLDEYDVKLPGEF